MNRAPRATLLALLLISLAARLTVENFLPKYPREWFPLCRVFEFGLGIYLAQQAQLASALRWRAPAYISRILEILGELSFPAFLIHWLFRNVYLHLGPPLHVLVFLIMTMSVSYVVLSVDSYLQRALFGAARGSCSPVVFKLSVARKAWTSLWGRALPSNPMRNP
jgi:peptidoglycan/LPS O-acetylase OafA/YrhL